MRFHNDFAREQHVSRVSPERTTGLPAGGFHECAQFVTTAPQRQPVARSNYRQTPGGGL